MILISVPLRHDIVDKEKLPPKKNKNINSLLFQFLNRRIMFLTTILLSRFLLFPVIQIPVNWKKIRSFAISFTSFIVFNRYASKLGILKLKRSVYSLQAEKYIQISKKLQLRSAAIKNKKRWKVIGVFTVLGTKKTLYLSQVLKHNVIT